MCHCWLLTHCAPEDNLTILAEAPPPPRDTQQIPKKIPPHEMPEHNWENTQQYPRMTLRNKKYPCVCRRTHWSIWIFKILTNFELYSGFSNLWQFSLEVIFQWLYECAKLTDDVKYFDFPKHKSQLWTLNNALLGDGVYFLLCKGGDALLWRQKSSMLAAWQGWVNLPAEKNTFLEETCQWWCK